MTQQGETLHVPRPAFHLPPNEAWRQPDKWIDTKTGHALYDIKKLELPTDNRGIVRVDEAVAYVKGELFWDDYDWLEHPGWFDAHHFHFTEADYSPENNDGSLIPKRFRETPTLIGWGTRTFHNVLHEYTERPAMPDRDAMEEYIQSYLLAHKIFSGLINAAKNATAAQDMFAVRERTLRSGNVEPLYADDRVAQEIMIDTFSRHFLAFHEQRLKALALIERERIFNVTKPTLEGKPHVVAKRLGKVVTRGSVNLVDLLKTG
jgi:hypothetical protein